VWTNIIGNAIDAMGGHGTITIRTSARDGYVVAEIEDDGPGMTPETAARVFDPFFTTKPTGQGTGLGLNISHNIVVQEHKGRITVDSTPGRTTFQVFLPITTPARPHAGRTQINRTARAGRGAHLRMGAEIASLRSPQASTTET